MENTTKSVKPFFCNKPWTSLQIDDHKGNVNTCCWSKINCGNVNNNSIKEIWNNEHFIYLRQKMAAGDTDAICAKDCPYLLGETTEKIIEPSEEICRNNWLIQQSEIRNRSLILSSKPIYMRVVPTVACNLTCVMCYQDRHDSVVLPPNIESQLYEFFPTLQELLVLGGEPLLDAKCINLINSIDSKKLSDLKVALITNGTLVNQKVEKILLEKNISWILVSVDAASAGTYKKIRGGKFEKVLEGIRRLKAIREKQKSNWDLIIGFTFMRSNFRETCSFIDLAAYLNVDFAITPIFGDWHNEYFNLDKIDIQDLKDTIIEIQHHLVRKGFNPVKVDRLKLLLEDLEASYKASSSK